MSHIKAPIDNWGCEGIDHLELNMNGLDVRIDIHDDKIVIGGVCDVNARRDRFKCSNVIEIIPAWPGQSHNKSLQPTQERG